jgi:3-methyladenine DNA glycosylase/8-oxoguanine DNA glycosylase
LKGKKSDAYGMVGNFPSPRELANLDESFLRTRCNLGYRAGRILKLAQSIVEGRIQLTQLEEVCQGASLSNYNKFADHLKGIDGFGPFTCANVPMCMGFYHVIPTDSETIRHLRQVFIWFFLPLALSELVLLFLFVQYFGFFQ